MHMPPRSNNYRNQTDVLNRYTIPTPVHETGWYYDKQNLRMTPSFQDGITYDVEAQHRKDGARFIIETGNKMDLGYNTMATGVVYFHRFYMMHSFKVFPKYLTASACLFLAGKVEETPKKCRDIVKMAEKILPESEFLKFGADPREELMILERMLLQTIRFDLQVEHPYTYLLRYAKSLKGDKTKMEKMLQMAWTFVNDSLCTTLSLQWEPEIIAIAMIHLAAKLSKYEINDWIGRQSHQNRWWDMFAEGITLGLMEEICHQVLDLYSQKRAINDQHHMAPLKFPSMRNKQTDKHPSPSTSTNNVQTLNEAQIHKSGTYPVGAYHIPGSTATGSNNKIQTSTTFFNSSSNNQDLNARYSQHHQAAPSLRHYPVSQPTSSRYHPHVPPNYS